MSGWTLVGVAMILVGAAVGAPGLLLIGGLTLLSRWLTTLWSRYGLDCDRVRPAHRDRSRRVG